MFSRIIYHGYDNTTKTSRDYVITQHVLWEYIASIRSDLTINTGWYFDGFNYQVEKAKIMSKVNSHNNSASFHGTTHDLITGESLTINDSNGVLANSIITDKGGLDISISSNQIKLILAQNHQLKK